MPHEFDYPAVHLECDGSDGTCSESAEFPGEEIHVGEPGMGWRITPSTVGEWEWDGDEAFCPECKKKRNE